MFRKANLHIIWECSNKLYQSEKNERTNIKKHTQIQDRSTSNHHETFGSRRKLNLQTLKIDMILGKAIINFTVSSKHPVSSKTWNKLVNSFYYTIKPFCWIREALIHSGHQILSCNLLIGLAHFLHYFTIYWRQIFNKISAYKNTLKKPAHFYLSLFRETAKPCLHKKKKRANNKVPKQ